MIFSQPPPPAATSAAFALSRRLPGLDMLRGIAALCVVFLHLQAMNLDHPAVFGKAYLAVDLFFMLSGYVMARTYEPRMARGLPPVSFFLSRYRRLWPVMAIGAAIGLPKLFMETPHLGDFVGTAALNLALLPRPELGTAFPVNIPAWSICLELSANLVHALLLWRLGLRGLTLLIGLALPLTAWAALTYGSLDVGAHSEEYVAGLPRVMLSYLIGIVLFRWWRDRPVFAVSPLLAYAAMPLAFAAAWLLGLADWRFDLTFVVVGCPLLIAGALRQVENAGPGDSIAAALGALSFPLYAVHMPVIQGMRMLNYGSIGGAAAALLAGIIVAIAAESLGKWRPTRREAVA